MQMNRVPYISNLSGKKNTYGNINPLADPRSKKWHIFERNVGERKKAETYVLSTKFNEELGTPSHTWQSIYLGYISCHPKVTKQRRTKRGGGKTSYEISTIIWQMFTYDIYVYITQHTSRDALIITWKPRIVSNNGTIIIRNLLCI